MTKPTHDANALLDAFFEILAERLTPLVAERLRGIGPSSRRVLSEEEPAHEMVYLSIAGFAARFSLSQKAVRRLIADGMPAMHPRPRTTRIPVARAEAWLAEQSGTADSAVDMAKQLARRDARQEREAKPRSRKR